MTEVADIIAGFQILNKYPECGICAEHDIIYVGPSDSEQVNEEDKAQLLKLGFHLEAVSNIVSARTPSR